MTQASRSWAELTIEEKKLTLERVQMFGGDYAKSLAEAYNRADAMNQKRLSEAMNWLASRYFGREWNDAKQHRNH